ncbi:GSCOCG00004478001-RA-CDS [Cotesia congregata]|nr:GSCOCG00004478001-RA-CDS [Cotesia congregata]
MDPWPLKSRALTPSILWYQDDGFVVLRIMLIDVDKFFLDIDLERLKFSTIHNDNNYYLCLYLFGAIIPEKSIVLNLGRELRIKFTKAFKFLKWPRLEVSKFKNPQITIDKEKYEETKWTLRRVNLPEWDSIEEYKRRNNIVNILPADDSNDESDDERDAVLSD